MTSLLSLREICGFAHKSAVSRVPRALEPASRAPPGLRRNSDHFLNQRFAPPAAIRAALARLT